MHDAARPRRRLKSLGASILFYALSTMLHAQEARVNVKPGAIAHAEFVAPSFGPSQTADFHIEAVKDAQVRGYLIGSAGLCQGRFEVEGNWQNQELVIRSPSKFGTIHARLRSAGAHLLRGPFTVGGSQGEMTVRISE